MRRRWLRVVERDFDALVPRVLRHCSLLGLFLNFLSPTVMCLTQNQAEADVLALLLTVKGKEGYVDLMRSARSAHVLGKRSMWALQKNSLTTAIEEVERSSKVTYVLVVRMVCVLLKPAVSLLVGSGSWSDGNVYVHESWLLGDIGNTARTARVGTIVVSMLAQN